ncbi:hypothetical protein [Methylobrevis pamukkalensis]|uniref:Uncharacterized protein n=1 Tax=Methylobrevis pamukkalensis TaxID=1439726 RepID=A0A1E3GYJ6_9HYPH|nr:hypothetical protein [Methylobrevis pamukkalensis]ODN69123.1 hypothetical protein A6302_03564 [Methylobrevis pamukkalensis]
MDGAARLRVNWGLLLGVFAVLAVILVIRTNLGAPKPLYADTDDAMRLVVVHDLLAGQGWYDHIQHRLNTPYGAPIHWSRLVDLPIAGLIMLLRPILGVTAEMAAAHLWPLMLLFALLWLSARLTLRLVGPDALLPALLLPAFSMAVLVEFSPGRIDHHNIQILLVLAMALATVEAWRRPAWAAAAGVAAATSLAIGTEGLPQVAATIAAFGLFWVIDPGRAAALRLFGASFALATLGHLALAVPPSEWGRPACDTLSVVYVAAAIGTGLVFALLPSAALAGRSPTVRLGAAFAAGGLLVAVLAVLFPDCRAGPYAALDPWLVTNWLDRIAEAKPVWTSLGSMPAYTAGVVLAPLAGLLAVAVRLWTAPKDRGAEWLALGLMLLFAVLVMLVQVRGARLAAPLAVPAGAWAIGEMRRRYLASRRPMLAVAMVGCWLAFCGIATSVFVQLAVGSGSARPSAATAAAPTGKSADCLMPAAFADLSALPAQTVMAPVDLGAHVLLYTPMSAVGAPYHRNPQGIIDTYAFFNGPPEAARDLLDQRGIRLVAICPAMAEMRYFPDRRDGSVASLLAKGETPDFLERIETPPSPITLYRVRDQARPTLNRSRPTG